MSRIATILVIFAITTGFAFSAVQPAASVSFSVSSLDHIQYTLIPVIAPSIITNSTILLDNLSVGNWLATVTLNNGHLDKQIKWDDVKTKVAFYNNSTDTLELSLTNLSLTLDFDYKVSSAVSLSGTGQIVITGLSISVLAKLTPLNDVKGWTVVLSQNSATVQNLEISMTPSIISALAQLLKGTIKDQLTSGLSKALPGINQMIQDFSTSKDPRNGAVFITNTDYFFSLDVPEEPTSDRKDDYIEIQFNGLAYDNTTLVAHADNSITDSQRILNSWKEQIYVSDNTIQSLAQALSGLLPKSIPLAIPSGAGVQVLEMLMPVLKAYFGADTNYTASVSLQNNSPEVKISPATLDLNKVSVAMDLFATNSTHTNTPVITFAMNLTTTLNVGVYNYKVSAACKNTSVPQDNFLMTSHIGNVGRDQENMRGMLNVALEIAQSSACQYVNGVDLSKLVPAPYNMALSFFTNSTVALGVQDHYAVVGFNFFQDQ